MAGVKCPGCGEKTFFQTTNGRKCSQCGYEMILVKKLGRGSLCPNCKKFTVRTNKCTNCGAKFIIPTKKENA